MVSSTFKALVLALSLGCATSTSFVYAQSPRVEISEGERAYAALQVQNVMSKHAYYHAAGMNLEEVDALWVSRNGKYASTATFASPMWVMNGLEVVRGAYGEENQRNREKALKALSATDPSVKDIPANYGAGHEWAMHTNTTAIIEVAGDGKTAKGVWYSPGIGLFTRIEDGRARAGGTFFWEKYAGDFVKENGVWKIWHLQMAYDFVPSLPEDWTDPLSLKPGETLPPKGERKPQETLVQAGERITELPPGFLKPKYSYPLFTPERPGIIYPQLPEPYYTFKETFSYCNCDQTPPE
ncbi:MAG: nuclear transport factor 2 family protein [Asticcacaulis sp.]